MPESRALLGAYYGSNLSNASPGDAFVSRFLTNDGVFGIPYILRSGQQTGRQDDRSSVLTVLYVATSLPLSLPLSLLLSLILSLPCTSVTPSIHLLSQANRCFNVLGIVPHFL